MGSSAPSNGVLAAFDVDDDQLVRLSGGQGQTWRAGRTVLKPVHDIAEAEWVAETLADLPEAGFRVSRPIATTSGQWIKDGWAAWKALEGTHDVAPGRWASLLQAGRDFHAALATVPAPRFFAQRSGAWAHGDRAAWGEVPIHLDHDELAPLIDRLLDGLESLNLPCQVIHGDLTGNVLFADGLPPAIIDFSPYHRPAAFALAVVVNDAIAWHDAPWSVLDSVADIEHFGQLLRRAAIYRLVTADRLATPARPDIISNHVNHHRRVADLVDALRRS